LLVACGGNNGDDDSGPTGVALPMTSPDGSFYLANMTIASQTFKMDVDSGSTTTAVAGMGCTSCTGLSPLYAPTAAAVDTHKTTSTSYADGSSWMGEVFTDMIGLGGGTPDVSVNFASITTQTMFFTDTSYQGILGLGPKFLLEPNTTSYLDQVTKASTVPVMGFEMCGTTGTMWLGGFDPAAASAKMQYTPMVPISADQPFYALTIDDVALGGTSLGIDKAMFVEHDTQQNITYYPIVDTGTSLAYLPTAVANKLLTQVNGASAYSTLFNAAIDPNGTGCTNAKAGVTAAMIDSMLPTMSMSFPSASGADIVVTASATNSYMFDVGGGMFCFAVGDDGGFGSVLGDTFMRGFVSVIDVQNSQIGFAPDAGCAKSKKTQFATEGVPLSEHGHGPPGLRNR
jgi:hypothetical protein